MAEEGEIFVDWEMSDRWHILQFGTPAYHVGFRGEWTAKDASARKDGLHCLLTADAFRMLCKGLALVRLFDDRVVRPGVQAAVADGRTDLRRDLVRHMLDFYEAEGGEPTFGHPASDPRFLNALGACAERIDTLDRLREYYLQPG